MKYEYENVPSKNEEKIMSEVLGTRVKTRLIRPKIIPNDKV